MFKTSNPRSAFKLVCAIMSNGAAEDLEKTGPEAKILKG